jgi:S-(hydroxymethyl)glutathione dehydrogenase/alcohol dehydrogenase
MGSTTPKHDIPLYADLYLQGRFNLDDLMSREISLEQVDEGYEMLKDPDVTRVVITSGLS